MKENMDEVIEEPSTKIKFPKERNDMTCVGCGCRVKYFITFYAVATYIPNSILESLRGKPLLDIQKYLLLQNTSAPPTCTADADIDTDIDKCNNPRDEKNPKPNPAALLTIRIVAYRGISVNIYTNAIMEALTPRLKSIMLDRDRNHLRKDEGGVITKDDENHGTSSGTDGETNNDMEEEISTKLSDLKRQFQALNDPDQDIEEGTIMEMTIEDHGNGDLEMVYWSSMGGKGVISSREFCLALCLVYYEGGVSASVDGDSDGDGINNAIGDCVSVSHRNSVLRGIRGVEEEGLESTDWSISSTVTKGFDAVLGML